MTWFPHHPYSFHSLLIFPLRPKKAKKFYDLIPAPLILFAPFHFSLSAQKSKEISGLGSRPPYSFHSPSFFPLCPKKAKKFHGLVPRAPLFFHISLLFSLRKKGCHQESPPTSCYRKLFSWDSLSTVFLVQLFSAL